MKSNFLHRFSIGLLLATLGLIFAGGLVTSTNSGLSVPDWPLSYGRLMPPMIGGILYEHGHRMIAATVGFLTVLLAILFSRNETRSWLRKTAWAAVGLVVLQGVLGGLTVLLRLPKPISILHACAAQTFFCLVVALAVWTSTFWNETVLERLEPKGVQPLHQLGICLLAVSFLQLILGAIVRHTGWGIRFHISVAAVVLFFTLWIFRRMWRDHREIGVVRRSSIVLMTAIVIQIALGIGTYLLKMHEFAVIPIPFYAIALITSHVMVGAFVLGFSVFLALILYRTRPNNFIHRQTRLADYYELTKPGISFMAGVTALAGFILGSRGDIDLAKLIHTGIGTLIAAASAGSLNMLLERDVDAQMNRTKRRPLPSGRMQPAEALFLGSLAAVVSIVYLSWAVNLLTAFFAGLTISVYLYVYTPLKKISWMCTLAGAVAGALPPVMGWTAATGRIGYEAVILFGILFFWQFPHFFSLAWLYKEDYARAGLKMLPRINDTGTMTATGILVNSLTLLAVSLLPTFFHLSGRIYLLTALTLGLWMSIASLYFLMDRSYLKAKRVFLASILYIPILMIAMVLNSFAF